MSFGLVGSYASSGLNAGRLSAGRPFLRFFLPPPPPPPPPTLPPGPGCGRFLLSDSSVSAGRARIVGCSTVGCGPELVELPDPPFPTSPADSVRSTGAAERTASVGCEPEATPGVGVKKSAAEAFGGLTLLACGRRTGAKARAEDQSEHRRSRSRQGAAIAASSCKITRTHSSCAPHRRQLPRNSSQRQRRRRRWLRSQRQVSSSRQRPLACPCRTRCQSIGT